METHARAVIIGGGVVGCSILFYHLAKFGCRDAVLIERKELTSGSVLACRGLIHTINSDPNIARLHGYTINLYKEIRPRNSPVAFTRPGGIYLAATPERFDYLKQERAKARYMGLEADFISLKEDLNPLIDPTKYLGALVRAGRWPR